jgi:thiamine biosynthesis protein ThiI
MNEKNIFIVRAGEVALKGMNKPYFEKMLLKRVRHELQGLDDLDVYRHEGLIYVRSPKSIPQKEIIDRVTKVFGVASISPAVECESDLDKIGETAVAFMNRLIEERHVKTFKVEAKRADKTFPVKSPDIARIIGAKVLIGCKVLKVDVHDPDVRLFVDLRKDETFIYEKKISGLGGLPMGDCRKGSRAFLRRHRQPGRCLDDGEARHADRGHPFPFISLHERKGIREGQGPREDRFVICRDDKDAYHKPPADTGGDSEKLS